VRRGYPFLGAANGERSNRNSWLLPARAGCRGTDTTAPPCHLTCDLVTSIAQASHPWIPLLDRSDSNCATAPRSASLAIAKCDHPVDHHD